jgi:hypothetical protein
MEQKTGISQAEALFLGRERGRQRSPASWPADDRGGDRGEALATRTATRGRWQAWTASRATNAWRGSTAKTC